MKEYKLAEIVRGLSLAEFKRFGEFINSPFHNKGRSLSLLYEYVLGNFEDFNTDSGGKKKMFEHIHPGEPYNDQYVRTLISNFTRMLEKYLILTEIDKNPGLQKITLLNALRSRNIHKSFEATSKELLSQFEKEFNRNIDYYYNLISMNEVILNYQGENLDMNLDESYYAMSENTDKLFIVSKLKVINTLLSRKYQVFGNVKLKLWGIDEIISFIESNLTEIKKKHPTIYSEYMILMMMLKPEKEEFFSDLRVHVFKFMRKYRQEELEEVYYSLTNYCVNKIAVGEFKFLADLFRIYRTFEKHKFYMNRKNIQYTDFLSVIISGLNLNEKEWVGYFFNTYKSNIAHEFRRDTVNLSGALIHFSNKKYNESLELLSRVRHQNTYFYLKSKETLVKIYYEQDQKDAINPVIDAVKHYLKRHKEVLSIHYDRYMVFLSFLNRLLKVNGKDIGELQLIRNDIKRSATVIGRDWLMEKVSEHLNEREN